MKAGNKSPIWKYHPYIRRLEDILITRVGEFKDKKAVSTNLTTSSLVCYLTRRHLCSAKSLKIIVSLSKTDLWTPCLGHRRDLISRGLPCVWILFFFPVDLFCVNFIHRSAKITQGLPLNTLAMRETWVRPLGWEDPLEEGMAIHCSILAWRIPMDRGAWWTVVHGVTKSWTRLSDYACSTE